MNTPPLPSPGGKPTSPEQARLQAILQHFKKEFPLDPVTPFGQFFAKPSHAECHGGGLLTYVTPAEPTTADLRLCSCARKRRDRFVRKALLFEAARAEGDLAFAEGTVCSASELELPTNPRREEQVTSLGRVCGERTFGAPPAPAEPTEPRSELAS